MITEVLRMIKSYFLSKRLELKEIIPTIRIFDNYASLDIRIHVDLWQTNNIVK